MKKFIGSIVIAAMLISSTPAMANHRDRGHRYEHRQNRNGSDTGKIILGILGGAIIAGAINDRNRRDRRYNDHYYDPYERDYYTMPDRPQYYENYCVTEQMVNRFGEIYFRRICQ